MASHCAVKGCYATSTKGTQFVKIPTQKLDFYECLEGLVLDGNSVRGKMAICTKHFVPESLEWCGSTCIGLQPGARLLGHPEKCKAQGTRDVTRHTPAAPLGALTAIAVIPSKKYPMCAITNCYSSEASPGVFFISTPNDEATGKYLAKLLSVMYLTPKQTICSIHLKPGSFNFHGDTITLNKNFATEEKIKCAVVGCTSTDLTPKVFFVSVPKAKDKLKEWASLLKVPTLMEGQKVCSLHFTQDSFIFGDNTITKKKDCKPNQLILCSAKKCNLPGTLTLDLPKDKDWTEERMSYVGLQNPTGQVCSTHFLLIKALLAPPIQEKEAVVCAAKGCFALETPEEPFVHAPRNPLMLQKCREVLGYIGIKCKICPKHADMVPNFREKHKKRNPSKCLSPNLSMPLVKCSIPQCPYTSQSCGVYMISPRSRRTIKDWSHIFNYAEFNEETSKLCSKHFSPEDLYSFNDEVRCKKGGRPSKDPLVRCSVKSCIFTSKSYGIDMISVPKDQAVRDEWRILLGEEKLELFDQVCSKHFLPGDLWEHGRQRCCKEGRRPFTGERPGEKQGEVNSTTILNQYAANASVISSHDNVLMDSVENKRTKVPDSRSKPCLKRKTPRKQEDVPRKKQRGIQVKSCSTLIVNEQPGRDNHSKDNFPIDLDKNSEERFKEEQKPIKQERHVESDVSPPMEPKETNTQDCHVLSNLDETVQDGIVYEGYVPHDGEDEPVCVKVDEEWDGTQESNWEAENNVCDVLVWDDEEYEVGSDSVLSETEMPVGCAVQGCTALNCSVHLPKKNKPEKYEHGERVYLSLPLPPDEIKEKPLEPVDEDEEIAIPDGKKRIRNCRVTGCPSVAGVTKNVLFHFAPRRPNILKRCASILQRRKKEKNYCHVPGCHTVTGIIEGVPHDMRSFCTKHISQRIPNENRVLKDGTLPLPPDGIMEGCRALNSSVHQPKKNKPEKCARGKWKLKYRSLPLPPDAITEEPLESKEEDKEIAIPDGKKRIRNCRVTGCPSVGGVTKNGLFHFAPRRPEVLKRWASILQLDSLPSNSPICAKHFSPDSFRLRKGKLVLKFNTLPLPPDTIQEEPTRSAKEEKNYCHVPGCHTVTGIIEGVRHDMRSFCSKHISQRIPNENRVLKDETLPLPPDGIMEGCRALNSSVHQPKKNKPEKCARGKWKLKYRSLPLPPDAITEEPMESKEEDKEIGFPDVMKRKLYCRVTGCPSVGGITKNVSFHRAPRQPDMLQRWASILQLDSLPMNSPICSKHFSRQSFIFKRAKKNERLSVSPDAVEEPSASEKEGGGMIFPSMEENEGIRGTPVGSCCVSWCPSTEGVTKDVSWHIIPRDRALVKSWSKILKIHSLRYGASICSKHFAEGSTVTRQGKLYLKIGALPVLPNRMSEHGDREVILPIPKRKRFLKKGTLPAPPNARDREVILPIPKRKHSGSCRVPGCLSVKEVTEGVSWHLTPKNKGAVLLWAKILKVSALPAQSAVCSKHFPPHSFITIRDRRCLKKGTLPAPPNASSEEMLAPKSIDEKSTLKPNPHYYPNAKALDTSSRDDVTGEDESNLRDEIISCFDFERESLRKCKSGQHITEVAPKQPWTPAKNEPSRFTRYEIMPSGEIKIQL